MSTAHYKIRDWGKHFENNRTREMDKMRWVPVPNKHDGEGFQRIMQEKDGIQIYGCWHLILQVASKMPVRGTLLREDGTPITASILALKTGWRHPQDFQRALDFCSSSDVAWIEQVKPTQPELPQEGAANPQEPARKGIEEKEGKEENKRKRIDYSEDFERFWKAYPRKELKLSAFKAFKACNADVEILISAAIAQSNTHAWKKECGKYIPHPATWLNKGGWDNDIASMNRGAPPENFI